MTIQERLLTNPHTGKVLDYEAYLQANQLPKLFGIDQSVKQVAKKVEKSVYEGVDANQVALAAEWDDLIRLHFLVRSRKVTTILEFGIGKSTVILADALARNKVEYGDFVQQNLRRDNAFELHSLDNYEKWIDECKSRLPKSLESFVHFHHAKVEMTIFNGRACTMYEQLPNICPDFIYLDAPDQFGTLGDVRGISTRTKDRLPMAADLLLIEPFLLPGTLIIVDGRTANARFLRNNLQQNWDYHHFEEMDIHAFELVERPLGKYNARQLKFCLGKNYLPL